MPDSWQPQEEACAQVNASPFFYPVMYAASYSFSSKITATPTLGT